jgi:ribonuclease R
LGKLGDDTVFVHRVIVEANVPVEFSPETEKYVNKLADSVKESDIAKRKDLRKLPFVTIDGEDARDFDDAVYAARNPDGSFNLAVAIADVAHYVKHGSALDLDAFARSTSIYFPRRVIPMLPEKLSNGLCSLNPNVDRLVMVCEMEISAKGEITNYSVDNAVIHSHYRLTYNQAQKYLDGSESAPSDILDSIAALNMVYQALLAGRKKRGAIDFDSSEPYFEFDEVGNVTGLKPRDRLTAHRLIEECMLAANVSVADFLAKSEHPTLYRNHDRPSEKKFSALKNYLDSIGVSFDVTQETVKPMDYQRLVEQIKDRPNSAIIQQTILRSMQLAEYTPKNIGHFGLAYTRYLHFTSPIRRYPDLLVHRACKAVIKKKAYAYLHSIETIGEQTSFCERRAEELERKVDAYYKCKFAKSHIGNEFTGLITSVVSFGLFVSIPELLIDGLVHVTELGGDYFVFDERKHVLVGKNSGFKYMPGGKLQVMIAAVDMDKLFIDLELAKGEDSQPQ